MRSSHLPQRLRVYLEGPRKAIAHKIAIKPSLNSLEEQLANYSFLQLIISSQLDNRVWADEFHAYASNDPDLDDLDDYEITELPIIPPAPSLEPQDFLRAHRRYHTPAELENDVPETPQHQLILRDLSVSPPPIYRAPPATYKEKVWIERDPVHRRYTYAQIIHIHGFTCSAATVRRALAEEGIFRFKARRAPWIRSPDRDRAGQLR